MSHFCLFHLQIAKNLYDDTMAEGSHSKGVVKYVKEGLSAKVSKKKILCPRSDYVNLV